MQRKPVVYVLDDHDAVLAAVAALLQTSDHFAECFSSPTTLLARCNPRRPGCLVVDLAMPGVDVRRFLERVHALHGRLPVVAVTLDPVDALETQWQSLGVIAFLRKPFDAAEFLAAIDAALAYSEALFES